MNISVAPPNAMVILIVITLLFGLPCIYFGFRFRRIENRSVLARDFSQDESQDDGDRKNDQRVNVEVLQEFHDSLQLLLNSGKVRAALAADVGRFLTSTVPTLFPTQTFVKFPFRGQA